MAVSVRDITESPVFAFKCCYRMQAARLTEKERMWLNGGPGVYSCDYRKYYDLATDDWKFDRIPEIMDGKNVADYVDADIEARLDALEQEEDQLEVSF